MLYKRSRCKIVCCDPNYGELHKMNISFAAPLESCVHIIFSQHFSCTNQWFRLYFFFLEINKWKKKKVSVINRSFCHDHKPIYEQCNNIFAHISKSQMENSVYFFLSTFCAIKLCLNNLLCFVSLNVVFFPFCLSECSSFGVAYVQSNVCGFFCLFVCLQFKNYKLVDI